MSGDWWIGRKSSPRLDFDKAYKTRLYRCRATFGLRISDAHTSISVPDKAESRDRAAAAMEWINQPAELNPLDHRSEVGREGKVGDG